VTMQKRYRFPDPLFRMLPDNLQVISNQAGEFYRVIGTKSSVELSISKMDQPRTTRFKECKYWAVCKNIVFNECEPILRDPEWWGTEQILVSTNMDTSNGQPWLRLGYKKKRDFYSSAYCRHYLATYDHVNGKPPVWKIADKMEWYPIEKIILNKVRTFIIPPAHFVHLQKLHFGNQNERLKMYWWSAYGFCPYSGGVHRIAEVLNQRRVKISYDVGNWDRGLPHLPTVYRLRTAFMPDDSLLDWIVENTVHSYLLHPNGHLLYKKIGNNSGSVNTTTDNIIAHFYIITLTLLVIYKGDVDKVKLCHSFIFGDDNVLSLDTHLSFQKIESIFRKVFSWFGMTLDPFYISEDLRDCNFLGFSFAVKDGFWYPKYNISRLLASFCYEYDGGMTIQQSFCKAYSLYIMAVGTMDPVVSDMRRCLESYQVILRACEDSFSQQLGVLDILTEGDIFKFYNGLEGGIKCKFLKNGFSEDYYYDDLQPFGSPT